MFSVCEPFSSVAVQVFFEALRFYYVAPGTTRLLHKDTVAGEHRIPAGTYVMVIEIVPCIIFVIGTEYIIKERR